MSYQKHTTHTDALDTLGTLIDDGQKRDAIHLAVFPAQAAEGMLLRPGDHVSLVDGKAVRQAPGKGVGIVDPFLTDLVLPGKHFWLVVYPRQISSLRHVWEHPAFPESGETEVVAPVQEPVREPVDQTAKAKSEAWLRAFVDKHDLPDFGLVVAACTGKAITPRWEGDDAMYYKEDDYITFIGTDAHCDVDWEFWHHMAVYTGAPVEDSKIAYLGCSC